MSNDQKSLLNRAAAVATIIAAIGAALIKAWILTPHDLDQLRAETIPALRNQDVCTLAEIAKVKEERSADHDLLQRIDERLANMQRDMADLKTRGK